MNLLQEKGFWEDLVDRGGSREYILSMPVSDPSLNRLDSSGRRNLTSELNEYSSSKKSEFNEQTPAKKRGHKDIRSSLSSISANPSLIRSLSTYTDSGACFCDLILLQLKIFRCDDNN